MNAVAAPLCASCDEQLLPGAVFCRHCGHPVEAKDDAPPCERCGAAMAPGAMFCRACGAKVGEPDPSATVIVAEKATACASCGADMVPGAAFCRACGTRVGERDPLATVEVAEVAEVPAAPPSWAPPTIQAPTASTDEHDDGTAGPALQWTGELVALAALAFLAAAIVGFLLVRPFV